jgi:crotonobetainyl-CoA:carnitine CoA-transferase CaiB-like acyl-CoA transferase
MLLMTALHHQRETGVGAYIDMSQSETGLMLSGTSLLEHQLSGKPTIRYGNRMPFLDWSPHGAYRCAGEDHWITISVQSDAQWRALIVEMGSPEWAVDARFANAIGRKANEDELDRNLTTFTSANDRYDLMNRLQSRSIPSGVVQKAPDRFDQDAQLKAREYYVDLPHSEIGTWPVEGFPAKLIASPADVGGLTGRASPKLGEDNDFIYQEVFGLTPTEMTILREENVI